MEELERLVADLKSALEAKESELMRNGHYNVYTKSSLANQTAIIKIFEVDCMGYFKNKIHGPDVVEKMKKEHLKIKSSIEGIS